MVIGTAIGTVSGTQRVEIVRCDSGRPEADLRILLVHGWGGSHQVWNALVQVAAGDDVFFRSVDLRGHGRSRRTPGEHRIPAMADDLIPLVPLVERAEPAWLVVGHSMGANVAVELAIRRPDLVRGLVSIDPAYDDPGWADADERVAALQQHGSSAGAAGIASAFAPDADPRLVDEARRVLTGTAADVLIDALRSTYLDPDAFGHRAATEAKLAHLGVPMLSLYARPEVAARARRLPVPSAHTVTIVPGSGHFVPVEQPDAVWRAIRGWSADLR